VSAQHLLYLKFLLVFDQLTAWVDVSRATGEDLERLAALVGTGAQVSIPMRLTCPACNTLHIDEGEFATKPHHTHACQECGNVWRPAIVATTGVMFLPGFKSAVAR
jgi:hypothetical protein